MSLETPENIRRFQRKLYAKAKAEPSYRFYLLYDKVHREDILLHAWRLVRQNGGAPGVDGRSFKDIETEGLEVWMARLEEELRGKTYKPDPVRRVMIPKPNGGQRPLGIPTIRDRVVQMAAKLVLEPIFEADFEPEAYGYRPKRGAQDAIREVHRALWEGYTDVVDADVSKYFDTIPHTELMQSVARRVSDRWMLKLVKMWLKAPTEERDEQGRRRMSGGKASKQGTPQGGVLSPLLANMYMHRYLRHWRRQGKAEQYRARIVNYADDFVILSRGHAEEALAWTKRVMEAIGLTLNMTKTSIRNARRETFDFLGYTFGPQRCRKGGLWYFAAKPSKRSAERLKEKVKRILHPAEMDPWEDVVVKLNRVLRGWRAYFGYGSIETVHRHVHRYVESRVRHFLRKRHKVSSRGTRQFPDRVIFGELGVHRILELSR